MRQLYVCHNTYTTRSLAVAKRPNDCCVGQFFWQRYN